GHRRGRLALDDEPDGRVGLESVPGQYLQRVAEPLEDERRAGDQLELELGVVSNGLRPGLEQRRVRAAGGGDTHREPGNGMGATLLDSGTAGAWPRCPTQGRPPRAGDPARVPA